MKKFQSVSRLGLFKVGVLNNNSKMKKMAENGLLFGHFGVDNIYNYN